jgi:hypothetical protein
MQQSCDRVGARSAPFGVLVSLKRRVRAARPKPTSLYFNCISFLRPFAQDLYIVQQRGNWKSDFLYWETIYFTNPCVQTVDVIYFVKKNNVLFKCTELDRHVLNYTWI